MDQEIMKIEFALPNCIPPSHWHRAAEKKARQLAKENGVDYRDCEVFVMLPERGRCYKKDKGFISLCAHG